MDSVLQQAQTTIATMLIPDNVTIGVAATLALSGIVHMTPGPTLKLQASLFKLPQWFLFCAGLLMTCSGALYYYVPFIGIFAVSVCMGGAAVVGIKLQGPPGAGGSLGFLSAALWAEYRKAEIDTLPAKAQLQQMWFQLLLCLLSFSVGTCGVIYSHVLNRWFAKLVAMKALFAGAKTQADKTASKPAGSDTKNKDGTKKDDASLGQAKAGARKRVSSPGAKAKSR